MLLKQGLCFKNATLPSLNFTDGWDAPTIILVVKKLGLNQLNQAFLMKKFDGVMHN